MGIILVLFFLVVLGLIVLRAAFSQGSESKQATPTRAEGDAKSVEHNREPSQSQAATQIEGSAPDFLLVLRNKAGEEHAAEWSRFIAWDKRTAEWGVAAFVDCETTGLAQHDELIELAVILFCFDRTNAAICGIVDSYSGLREPMVEINPFAARTHHITPDTLAGKTLDGERVESILERAEFFIAHNAAFDRRFVVKLFPKRTGSAGYVRWLMSIGKVTE